MKECTRSEADVAGRNPTGHHRPIKMSPTWQWRVSGHSQKECSAEAKARLSWITWHEEHGSNVTRTCERFAITRPTFYLWFKRYKSQGVAGLETRSRRPLRVRSRSWTLEDIDLVSQIRLEHPKMGKCKIRRVLSRRGIWISASTIGRIIHHLTRRGQLPQLVPQKRPRPRVRVRRYACRKPQDWIALFPGDLVQIDTMEVKTPSGHILKHLSAVDVVTRYAAAELSTRATATVTTDRLQRMLARLPFRVAALQIDGGSEFKGVFETFCEAQGIALFVLPPRSPKLNGCVERIQRTFHEEFYQCWAVKPVRRPLLHALREFETSYNTFRPHQALGYDTPQEKLDSLQRNQA